MSHYVQKTEKMYYCRCVLFNFDHDVDGFRLGGRYDEDCYD